MVPLENCFEWCENSWFTFFIEPQILKQAENSHSIGKKNYWVCSWHQCLQREQVSKELMKVSQIYAHFTTIVSKILSKCKL